MTSELAYSSMIPNGRVRPCYRLNLESCMDPSTSVSDAGNGNRDYGRKFCNNNTHTTPLQAAIQTANIFHGIVVGKDGVLLAQNKRAGKHGKQLLGKIVEEGQSRHAVRIERVLDATDSRVLPVGKNSVIPSKQESQLLVVHGQFDDINRLVFEGVKILREKKTAC